MKTHWYINRRRRHAGAERHTVRRPSPAPISCPRGNGRLHQGVQRGCSTRGSRTVPSETRFFFDDPRNSTRRSAAPSLGASRDYVDAGDTPTILGRVRTPAQTSDRRPHLHRRRRGTLNGMQALFPRSLPTVLAPKDDRPTTWASTTGPSRTNGRAKPGPQAGIRIATSAGRTRTRVRPRNKWSNLCDARFTRRAVFVSAGPACKRIRTTAESHRRIAIVEVMGRHAGYIAPGQRLRPARRAGWWPRTTRSTLTGVGRGASTEVYELSKNIA